MKLLKTSILSSFSVAAKVLTGFLIMKFAALQIGANGIALVGQFQTLLNIVAVIGGGGISIGAIKYVAEYYQEFNQLKIFLSTAFIYAACFSLFTMIVSIFFAEKISLLIFGSQNYSYLIYTLSFIQFFIAFNILSNAVFNGMKKIKILTKISIYSSCASCLFVILSMVYFKLAGTLLALIFVQCIPFIISIYYIFKETWRKYFLLFIFDKSKAYKLFHYSIMTVISAASLPVAQILVRYDLAHLFSWQDVGYWQAVLRISDAYLLLISTILSAYYLPKLSELNQPYLIKKEIFSTAKFIIPVFLATLLLIYFLRKPILLILYTEDFFPALQLFFWQLTGDFFRLSGLLCTYLLLAKSFIKLYILTEIMMAVCFVIFEYYLSRMFGLIGVTYAFAGMSFIYFLVMLTIFLLYLMKKIS